MDRLLEREQELERLDVLLDRPGGLGMIEGGSGSGKTSLVQVVCERARARGWDVLQAQGAELESDYPFGVVRQLFERRVADAGADERELLFSGPAASSSCLLHEANQAGTDPTSFALIHGLYWLAVNLSTQRPVLIAVDDLQYTDEASMRWLAYLARRIDGTKLVLLFAHRLHTSSDPFWPTAFRGTARLILEPAPLSPSATAEMVSSATNDPPGDDVCIAVWEATGGNPLYVTELLRAARAAEKSLADMSASEVLERGAGAMGERVMARVMRSGDDGLRLAQATAVLGDGCSLHTAAQTAGTAFTSAVAAADHLVRAEVLATSDPARFVHPVLREAVAASMSSAERALLHRRAAHALHAVGASDDHVAAHLLATAPAGDAWVVSQLVAAANKARAAGSPGAAADFLARALSEPPSDAERIALLRAAASAEAEAGRAVSRDRLARARLLAADARERAELSLELARTCAGLFRWAEAVEIAAEALAERETIGSELASRLEAELVVAALHDGASASQVGAVLGNLAARVSAPLESEELAVARGMAMLLAGQSAADAAEPLELALATHGSTTIDINWNTRAALLWSLVVADRIETVERSMAPMRADVDRSRHARGLVAVYSTAAVAALRRGALAEAASAARVALEVIEVSDLTPGRPFAVSVLADVAIEAGELSEAEELLASVPPHYWVPGVGGVLLPAALGRLHLAQGRALDALADFRGCGEMFDRATWGIDIRDVGYVHARSGAALALYRLGEQERACEVALDELDDVRRFGATRPLGVALRTAGVVHGGSRGLELLEESVQVLHNSCAVLERAHALCEFGAALRRAGSRVAAREPLAESLDLASTCGARPLAVRAREELQVAGARPRRDRRVGVEALTPIERQVARFAALGHTNRDIAQTLYVSIKTVEGHLSHIYMKLRVTGRAELQDALGEAFIQKPG